MYFTHRCPMQQFPSYKDMYTKFLIGGKQHKLNNFAKVNPKVQQQLPCSNLTYLGLQKISSQHESCFQYSCAVMTRKA